MKVPNWSEEKCVERLNEIEMGAMKKKQPMGEPNRAKKVMSNTVGRIFNRGK